MSFFQSQRIFSLYHGSLSDTVSILLEKDQHFTVMRIRPKNASTFKESRPANPIKIVVASSLV
jgi:hypothetical protein